MQRVSISGFLMKMMPCERSTSSAAQHQRLLVRTRQCQRRLGHALFPRQALSLSLLWFPLSAQTKRVSEEASSLSLPLCKHLTKRGRPSISFVHPPTSLFLLFPPSSFRFLGVKDYPTSKFLASSFHSMEQYPNWASNTTRKRKTPALEEDVFNGIPLDELSQDLLERVLSWLPTSSFFRLRSVCKRWSSVASSATFRIACSGIPSRDPWFYMVDPNLEDQSIVFDTTEGNWKNLNYPSILLKDHNSKSIPVASSGGLVCFRAGSGNFVVCNPITGTCRELPTLNSACQNQTIHAIVMNSSSQHSSYKLVLVLGELPNLAVKIFDSARGQWEDDFILSRKLSTLPGCDQAGDETVYFLSKAGNVVATNMQRSPSKQYSSVITVVNGEEVVYFLSHSGTIVACNLTRRCFSEFPRLLPVFFEYSIDVVECRGEMLVVVLWEFLESASLRVWRYSEAARSWTQVAAMPPAMSHEFYGKKADINCVGCGDRMLICVNSGEFSSYILCDLVMNEWIELPNCVVEGKAREFMSAFSFEPRVEASV